MNKKDELAAIDKKLEEIDKLLWLRMLLFRKELVAAKLQLLERKKRLLL